jgi:hypothetical protein
MGGRGLQVDVQGVPANVADAGIVHQGNLNSQARHHKPGIFARGFSNAPLVRSQGTEKIINCLISSFPSLVMRLALHMTMDF